VRDESLKTITLWESYVGDGAPSNAAGARFGLGWTKKEASRAAEHWNNQAPYERFRRVVLIDRSQPGGPVTEGDYAAEKALDFLELKPTLSKDEQEAMRLLREGRYASAWLKIFPPPKSGTE
jgi:hypothetical protein